MVAITSRNYAVICLITCPFPLKNDSKNTVLFTDVFSDNSLNTYKNACHIPDAQ